MQGSGFSKIIRCFREVASAVPDYHKGKYIRYSIAIFQPSRFFSPNVPCF